MNKTKQYEFKKTDKNGLVKFLNWTIILWPRNLKIWHVCVNVAKFLVFVLKLNTGR